MKNSSEYIKYIIKKFPGIKSGRKNYYDHERRINKNLILIKKFFNKIKKSN